AYRGRTTPARARTAPVPRRDAGAQRYALGRVERPKPKREIHVPWRRIARALVATSALGGVAYGAAWVVTGDSLRVVEIDITGAQVVDPHAVAFVSNLGRESMLTLDLAAADAAIEAMPAVKAATVERAWPDGVRITLTEHQAWGYWQAGGRVHVIDRDGQVLRQARPAPKDAPTIIDVASPLDLADGAIGDPDTVRLVARLLDEGVFEAARLRPTAFIFQRDRGLTVVAEGGPAAVFGDSSNYEFKVQAFGQVLRQIRAAGDATGSPQVAEVDLRFGRNVVLR
ncbi:MAG: FtsQ-type POTRA domain-containing protein, partial [Dehalococcoidia bacterium]